MGFKPNIKKYRKSHFVYLSANGSKDLWALSIGHGKAVLRSTNPAYRPDPNDIPERVSELRKTVQTVTQAVLADISKLNAARCCQRDSWLALKKAAELSKIYLPVPLRADHSLVCLQKENNEHCFGKACPLF